MNGMAGQMCREDNAMGYQNLVFDKESVFLVTGGAGFIGSNLCEAVLNMGYKVRCLDNLSTGKYVIAKIRQGIIAGILYWLCSTHLSF